jgi:5-dehydro-2-deoxygluconokinase
VRLFERSPARSIDTSNGFVARTEIGEVSATYGFLAGDAFMGGFATALAAGLPVRECIRRGSASAAIVVTRPGCSPANPTAIELDEFMTLHPPL